MNQIFRRCISKQNLVILIPLFAFLYLTLPIATTRPTGGRSGERQAQTAGMIRIYCQDSSRTFFQSPQVHYGNLPFNMENSFFEWVQGRIASAVDFPKCDSVEFIAKFFSSIFGALTLLGIYLIASLLWGQTAGALSMIVLCFNELWLRYSTYSMLDTRMIFCGIFAIYFTLKRKPILSSLFWVLQITQKPQTFFFFAPFLFVLEIYKNGYLIFNFKKSKAILLALISALFVSGIYYKISTSTNTLTDLPWVTWMGPRTHRWFFGNFNERFQFNYFKDLFLNSFNKTGLTLFIPLLIVCRTLVKFDFTKTLKHLLIVISAYFLGRFVYSFVFYNVFIVHEYYALPTNVGAALIFSACAAITLNSIKFNRKMLLFLQIGLGVYLVSFCINNIRIYNDFTKNINNPKDWRYNSAWNIELFPNAKIGDLVAMAGGGSGHDILPLYYTKKHGFAWCSSNKEFAPRKFWKDSGVKFVAWLKTHDSEDNIDIWETRTIEEELKIARENHWSSDENDVWASQTMSAWALLASTKEYDPCISSSIADPRLWK